MLKRAQACSLALIAGDAAASVLLLDQTLLMCVADARCISAAGVIAAFLNSAACL